MTDSRFVRTDCAKILVTITDGDDPDEYVGSSAFNEAVQMLCDQHVYSLSCGIGLQDVDHRGLAELARLTGGMHIAVHASSGIASALSDLTEFLHVRILSAREVRRGSDSANIRQLTAVQRTTSRVAADVLVMIDCSLSMVGLREDDSWNGDATKLSNAKQAAVVLIESLNASYDRVGVIRFDETTEVLRTMTQDFRACIRSISGMKPGPGTMIYRSIIAGATLLSPPNCFSCPDCGGIGCDEYQIQRVGWLSAQCDTCGRVVHRVSVQH